MAGEVRLKVLELYSHQDPAVKQAADAALREFQERDLAWSVAQELLADSDASVQFFGAQTLYSKVQQVAKGYQKAEGEALAALVAVLQQHLRSPTLLQQSKQRLVLALSAIAVHMCATLWPSVMPDVLSLAEAQPQCGWCVVLAIPEQLSSVVHTFLKTDRRTEALLSGSTALVTAALRLEPAAAEEAATGTLSDSAFSLALQSVTQWTKVLGMQPLQHDGFAAHLAALLKGPAGSSEPVLELLIEVLQSSPGAFAVYANDHQLQPPQSQGPVPGLEGLLAAVIGTMGGLLPGIQQMAENPAASLGEADAARLTRWARLASTLVEAYTQILWVESGAADVIVSFLGACFLVHPHIAQCVFELWAVLKDANRDGKLPPGILAGLLRRLAPPCIGSLARFGRLDSPHSEDHASLVQLRDAQQDIVVDLICISAGSQEAPWILSLLQEQLQRCEAAKDGHGLEVAWFAFSGIAEALADEPSLPPVYECVVQSIFRAEALTEDQAATAAVLLRTCGPHFEQGLRAQLAAAVQWLVGKVSQIPEVASEAVQELCGYAGQHLVPHVAEFLKVVEAAAASGALSASVDASLHGALVGIARHLPADQVVQAFVQICQGTTAMLMEGLDVGQDSGRERLHRCLCRLLRCTLVMEQGGSEPQQSRSGGGPTPAAQASATCLTAVLTNQWASLAPSCQRLLCAARVARDAPKGKPIFEYSDAAVQVNILALLRYAAKAANDAAVGGPELSGKILQFAGACCQEGQLACLYAVSVLAGNPQRARTDVLPVFGDICKTAVAQMQAGRSDGDLVPFLELISSLAASLGDELFQSGQVETLIRLCALALASAEQDILRPVLLFLQKLATSRSPAVSPQILQEAMQAVALRFHTWPRVMGAQLFKVFSAFLERHEAAFLGLLLSPSVPAVAGLQPGEQAVARSAFRGIRGPRLRAFLGDLGAVARGENSADVLQAYAMEG